MKKLNCKVKCVDDKGRAHTEGKIYNVIQGVLQNDYSYIYFDNDGEGFNSIGEINKWMRSQFELYEEKFIKEQLIEWGKENVIIVETRDSRLLLLVSNGKLLNNYGGGLYLDQYFENLCVSYWNDDYDIMNIYKTDDEYPSLALLKELNKTLLWERKKETVELTLDVIAKKFNCDVSQLKIKK